MEQITTKSTKEKIRIKCHTKSLYLDHTKYHLVSFTFHCPQLKGVWAKGETVCSLYPENSWTRSTGYIIHSPKLGLIRIIKKNIT